MYFPEFEEFLFSLDPLDSNKTIGLLAEFALVHSTKVNKPINNKGELILDYLLFCGFSRKKVVLFWLKHDSVDVNAVSLQTLTTPLTRAVLTNDIPRVYFLLQAGANPNIGHTSSGNYSALNLAARATNLHMMDFLFRAGANIEHRSDAGTSLAIALRTRSYECVSYLLENNAEVGDEDDGLSPVSVANNIDDSTLSALINQHLPTPQLSPASPTLHCPPSPPSCSFPSPTDDCIVVSPTKRSPPDRKQFSEAFKRYRR